MGRYIALQSGSSKKSVPCVEARSHVGSLKVMTEKKRTLKGRKWSSYELWKQKKQAETTVPRNMLASTSIIKLQLSKLRRRDGKVPHILDLTITERRASRSRCISRYERSRFMRHPIWPGFCDEQKHSWPCLCCNPGHPACHFTVSRIPRLESNFVTIYSGVFVIARYQLTELPEYMVLLIQYRMIKNIWNSCGLNLFHGTNQRVLLQESVCQHTHAEVQPQANCSGSVPLASTHQLFAGTRSGWKSLGTIHLPAETE